MAIVQIARITHRKGLMEDLPQLAGAEFGWAMDERRLFIGNGTIEDGAPVIGNTEILTEFSDIIGVAGGYTYKGDDAGYIAQTGPSQTSDVVRSLQDKLDEVANVKDFGAIGDGVTDDTNAINRALYQLFCREINEEVRRSLYFPAGVYIVSDTIKIPPYAKLFGEGAESSILRFDTNEAPPDYCYRTSDSLHQTGANIGNNGAITPRNIEISSMTFESNETTDVFLVEKAIETSFANVNFTGNLGEVDLSDAGQDTKAITIISSAQIETNQLTFDKCKVSGCTYGLYSNYNCKGVTYANGQFNTLYRGVVLGAAPVNGGPQGVRIVQNFFDKVANHGVEVGAIQYTATAYNVFYDVGNNFSGAGSPVTPVIEFNNDDNISVGDFFERTDVDDATAKRIELNGNKSIGFDGSKSIKVGAYERESGISMTLVDNTTTATIQTFSTTDVRGYRVDYSIVRGNAVRTGSMLVSSGIGANAPSISDEFSETDDVGVTFSVSQISTTLTFAYTTTSTGSNATFTYSIAKISI